MRLTTLSGLCLALACTLTACDAREAPEADAPRAASPGDSLGGASADFEGAGASLGSSSSMEAKEGSAQAFWAEFRAAAIAGDTARLRAMTHFPFTTRGTMDEDPTLEHGPDAFGPLILAILNETVYTPAEMPRRDALAEVETVNPRDQGGPDDWFRVNDLEFRFVDGAWKLTHAYHEADDDEATQ